MAVENSCLLIIVFIQGISSETNAKDLVRLNSHNQKYIQLAHILVSGGRESNTGQESHSCPTRPKGSREFG